MDFSHGCQHVDEDGHRKCNFNCPHPLQATTSIDVEGHLHYQRQNPGDEWVLPHCLPLLQKFQCHLNFEVANTSHLFEYLFKYIHKDKELMNQQIHIAEHAIFSGYQSLNANLRLVLLTWVSK
jgi:hypothetical protein